MIINKNSYLWNTFFSFYLSKEKFEKRIKIEIEYY